MKKWYHQRKIYTNWFIRKFIRISRRTVDFIDSFSDKKVCGVSLSKYVPSIAEGSTGSQSTPYLVLDTIFQDAVFTPEDSLIDVGCGKGRVLAYLLKKECPCKLNGIELNPAVAEYGQHWAVRYPNVNIMCDDVLVASESLCHNDPGRFMMRCYPIPEEGTSGKTTVRIHLTSPTGTKTGGIFYAYMLSANENETSAIGQPEAPVRHPVYDLSGRRIGVNDATGNTQYSMLNGQLPKGLYIVNGKKILN